MRARGLALACCLFAARGARAAPPTVAAPASLAAPAIVAVVGSPTSALVIGAHGEVYAPDGKGAWRRRSDGEIAGTVITAVLAGDVAIAGVANAPPFERLAAGGWSVMNVGLHASAIVGRGPGALAAVGSAIFALARGKATRVADAPAAVRALAGTPEELAVETDRGLFAWSRGAWTPLAKAPHHVEALLDAHHALVAGGVVDLSTGRLARWPSGFHAAAAVSAGDVVLAASARELLTLRGGAFARVALPALAAPVVAIAADRSGRVLVATSAGQLALREHGSWTEVTLAADPPIAHAGPPPAESR